MAEKAIYKDLYKEVDNFRIPHIKIDLPYLLPKLLNLLLFQFFLDVREINVLENSIRY
jgi:hypothetical protein